MSDINIELDTLNKRIAEQIQDDIESGVEKGGVALGEEARDVAKHRVRSVGAVFSGDLISSFDVDIRKSGNKMIVVLRNDSDHAAPIEYGASYGEEGPPVAALIPWVKVKMRGFDVPDDELADLPDVENAAEDTTIEEPDGSTTDLADAVSRTTLQKAFWLQQHIKEEGIDAVGYMKAAEQYAERRGSDTVAGYIRRELRT